MNSSLVLTFLRHRLSSRFRLVLALVFFAVPLISAAVGKRLDLASRSLVLVLGAGMVGQDISSGAITAIFVRPIRRTEYLLSRWLGVSIGAAAVVLLQAAMVFAVLKLREGAPEPGALALDLVAAWFNVLGVSAVLLLFSCLVNGLGDLALILLGELLGNVALMVGSFQSWQGLVRAGNELGGFLNPILHPRQLLGPGFSPFAIASYLSTVTLSLALAMILVNRKELSYAAE